MKDKTVFIPGPSTTSKKFSASASKQQTATAFRMNLKEPFSEEKQQIIEINDRASDSDSSYGKFVEKQVP